MRIYLNAGHSIEERGGYGGGQKENEKTMDLCSIVANLLRIQGFEVLEVPDKLKLRESINWVNRYVVDYKRDIAISLHFNAHSNPGISGTEVFYYIKENTKEKASVLSERVSNALGIRNRGAKPDTWAFTGLLGWLRLTQCASFLIEVSFLTSPEDMRRYDSKKAAQGILLGIQAISNTDEEITNLRQQIVSLKRQVIELLWFIIAKWKGR